MKCRDRDEDWCDCGNHILPEKSTCRRCQYLDGDGAEGRVIEYMRSNSGTFYTSGNLARDMETSKEHTLKLLRRLIDNGRVVRLQFSNEEALFCLVDGSRPSAEAPPCFVRRSEVN